MEANRQPAPVAWNQPSPGARQIGRWAIRWLLCLALCPFAGIRAEDWAPNLTLMTAWHDNAGNSNAAVDKIRALQTRADLIGTQRYDLGRGDSLHPLLRVQAEWWPRYERLTQAGAGGLIEWRHQFGNGPLAPVFSIEGGADAVTAKESVRRGTSSHAGVALRKRFDDAWRVTVRHGYARHDARGAVFDRRGSETAVEVDRDLSATARITFRASYRDGDVVSYATPPRPDVEALAPRRQELDTFRRPMVAHAIDARTTAARLGLIRAIDEHSAGMIGYEWQLTERRTLRYVNQFVSLGFVHQF
jgi:hypothetical protein